MILSDLVPIYGFARACANYNRIRHVWQVAHDAWMAGDHGVDTWGPYAATWPAANHAMKIGLLNIGYCFIALIFLAVVGIILALRRI